MSRIGLYGGSFDPIHNGHLITALYVLETRRLEKIIFVPCNISPHKINKHYLSNEHRLEMTRLAIEGFDNFEVSDYELVKGDISYTFDTLQHFAGKYTELELIVGFDNLMVFDSWKKPDEILELATLLVLKRNALGGTQSFNKYYEKAVFMQNPTIELSSSEIRDRIAKDKIVKSMIPDKVFEYIKKNDLYAEKK